MVGRINQKTEIRRRAIGNSIFLYNNLHENFQAPMSYGEINEPPSKQMIKLSRRIPQGGLVLDAGCGCGIEAFGFHKMGFSVIGIDLSVNSLRFGIKNLPAITSKLAIMDTTALAFPSGAFDAVWCRSVFLHLPPKLAGRAIGEFARVLKDNGTLFLWTMSGTPDGQIECEEEYRIDGYYMGMQYVKTYSAREMRPLLSSKGFTRIDMYDETNHEREGYIWLNVWARKKTMPSKRSIS